MFTELGLNECLNLFGDDIPRECRASRWEEILRDWKKILKIGNSRPRPVEILNRLQVVMGKVFELHEGKMLQKFLDVFPDREEQSDILSGVKPTVLIGKYFNTIGMKIHAFPSADVKAIVLYSTIGIETSHTGHIVSELTTPLYEHLFLAPKVTSTYRWRISNPLWEPFAFYDNILVTHYTRANSGSVRTLMFIARYEMKAWVRRFLVTYRFPLGVKLKALHLSDQLFSYVLRRRRLTN